MLDVCLPIIEQVAHAVGYAERAGYNHGNLHPGNIFLSKFITSPTVQVKVGDFGMPFIPENQDRSVLQYHAPEGSTATTVDVYSLGMLLQTLVVSQQGGDLVRRVSREALSINPRERHPDVQSFMIDMKMMAPCVISQDQDR